MHSISFEDVLRPPFGLTGAASKSFNDVPSGLNVENLGVLGETPAIGVVIAFVIGVANAKFPGVIAPKLDTAPLAPSARDLSDDSPLGAPRFPADGLVVTASIPVRSLPVA